MCICDVLLIFVPFVQFKKREKHPRRSVTFSKVAGYKSATLLNVTVLYECFSLFKIVQIVPNRATHHSFLVNTTYLYALNISKNSFLFSVGREF